MLTRYNITRATKLQGKPTRSTILTTITSKPNEKQIQQS